MQFICWTTGRTQESAIKPLGATIVQNNHHYIFLSNFSICGPRKSQPDFKLKEEKKREARKWRRLFLNEELTVEFIWRAILIIFSLKNLLKVFPTASWLSLWVFLIYLYPLETEVCWQHQLCIYQLCFHLLPLLYLKSQNTTQFNDLSLIDQI